jgi:hypothetical protein
MTIKQIEKLLNQALLHDGNMVPAIPANELIEIVKGLKLSMKKDKDDYIFTVTEDQGQVAMLLVEKSGLVYVNEQARARLKTLWPAAYESNMKQLIPEFAKQLKKGELPINGVKIHRT